MKKADMILIACIMVCCVLLLFPLMGKTKTASAAVVRVRSEEKMRIDLSHDGSYEVEGKNGTVHIEVKDGKVAVTQENSPHHYCSKQGFVDSPNTPIVCLPNETVVTIEGSEQETEEDTVIS